MVAGSEISTLSAEAAANRETESANVCTLPGRMWGRIWLRRNSKSKTVSPG